MQQWYFILVLVCVDDNRKCGTKMDLNFSKQSYLHTRSYESFPIQR